MKPHIQMKLTEEELPEQAPVLISRCLLGEPCRYHGKKTPYSSFVKRYLREHPETKLIPVCPEEDGGLPTPRPPCKRVGLRVYETCEDKTKRRKVTGTERTKEYWKGAAIALETAEEHACRTAILCKWSPSCDARGITGSLLIDHDIEVINTF